MPALAAALKTGTGPTVLIRKSWTCCFAVSGVCSEGARTPSNRSIVCPHAPGSSITSKLAANLVITYGIAAGKPLYVPVHPLLKVSSKLLERVLQLRHVSLQRRDPVGTRRPALRRRRSLLFYLHIARQQVRPPLLFVPRLPRQSLHKAHLSKPVQRTLHALQILE